MRNKQGDINTRKFINTADYSLELIKLREIYKSVYRKQADFSFAIEKKIKKKTKTKEYSKHLINVTFNYSNKEFNRIRKGVYIKFGYQLSEIEFKDCLCFKDGELIAVQTDEAVTSTVDAILLGKYFYIEEKENEKTQCKYLVYNAKTNIKTLNTVADLRKNLYDNGFVCDGIKYVRYKRSGGSSRVGKCLFINESLYKPMHKWELCGLNIKNNDPIDLAALESYISLPLSSIIGTVDIKPENILVIDDYNSTFTDDVIATDIKDGWLNSYQSSTEITNNIWDGQSLIDKSAMGEYSNYGFILLRNRFYKSACFNTNIQKWLANNGITDISQLNGFTLAKSIEDIKLITTPSSIKYLKFGKLQEWLKRIDSTFGVVKHDKPTHFFDGGLVQTHYQLLNTLQLSKKETRQLLKPSLDYLHMLKNDPSVFRYHIGYMGKGFSYDPLDTKDIKNEIIYKMLGINDKFTQTKLYYDYRAEILKSFVKNLKCGHVLISGTYATLLGNPIEMLKYSIKKFDGESQLGKGNIHSTRFPYGTKLLGSRSPHCTMGNILVANNTENKEIDKYFNLTNEIVCINSIGENTLNRLSGADMDSDTMLLTNSEILMNAAIKNYSNFLVPTNMVPAEKAERRYTSDDKADLDTKTSVNKIGEIINLSQELNTKLWHKVNNGESIEDLQELYCEIAKLSTLSGIEIDKAKKEFIVDSVAEIERIREKYNSFDDQDRMIKPKFFGVLARSKGYYDSNKKNYMPHDTTMDYVQKCVVDHRLPCKKRNFILFSEVVKLDNYDISKVKYEQTNKVIDCIRDLKKEMNNIWQSSDLDYDTKFKLSTEIQQEKVMIVNKIRMSKHTMYWLLKSIESEKCHDISRLMFKVLFGAPNIDFYDLVKHSQTPILTIEKCMGDDIEIYGFKFRKAKVM